MPINTTRWNRIRYTVWAPVYDLITRGLQKGRRRSIELLELKPGARVLLVGAGTGLDLELLPRNVTVIATDLTPAMVERIRRRARALGLAVEARVMDAQQLEFPDAAFDAVILHLILAVMPDPVAGIKEATRVLKPGGRMAILDKFVPEGATPPLWRRALNIVTNVLCTNVNRPLEPLLRVANLRVIHEERSQLGGLLKITIAVR